MARRSARSATGGRSASARRAPDRMRRAFRAAIGASDDPRDAIVEAVLARSVLQRWAALKASPPA